MVDAALADVAELFGAVASPLGDGAVDLTMVLAYVSLGLVGYLVYLQMKAELPRPEETPASDTPELQPAPQG